MIRGMTGYAHVEKEKNGIVASIDISSVNKRHLDIVCKIPHEHSALELEFRKAIQAKISRGHISLHIKLHRLHTTVDSTLDDHAPLDERRVTGRAKEYQDLARILRMRISKKDLFTLLAQDVEKLRIPQHGSDHGMRQETSLQYDSAIREAFQEALQILIQRKEEEGASLLGDFSLRTGELRKCYQSIKQKLGSSEERIQLHKSRYETLLKPFIAKELLFDDRMAREIVLLSDKYDASEEIQRIEHHLNSFYGLLENSPLSIINEIKRKEGVGKALEFLLQELLREFNTLGAKTYDADVSTYVIVAKTEIEKMREQIQNVE